MIYNIVSDNTKVRISDFLCEWSFMEDNLTNFVNGYIEMNVYNFHVDEDMIMTVQWAQRLLTATIELKRIINPKFVQDLILLSSLISILKSGMDDKALLN